MKKGLSIFAVLAIAFSSNTTYATGTEAKKLNTAGEECVECNKVLSAILSMQNRLCGALLTEEDHVEIVEKKIYKFAVGALQKLPNERKEVFLLAFQKGTNCIDDGDWIDATKMHYEYAIRRKDKSKRSLKFLRPNSN